MGGDWFDSFDEAEAHAGDGYTMRGYTVRGYTVRVGEQDIDIFGSYPSQEEYLDTSRPIRTRSTTPARGVGSSRSRSRARPSSTYEPLIESANAHQT